MKSNKFIGILLIVLLVMVGLIWARSYGLKTDGEGQKYVEQWEGFKPEEIKEVRIMKGSEELVMVQENGSPAYPEEPTQIYSSLFCVFSFFFIFAIKKIYSKWIKPTQIGHFVIFFLPPNGKQRAALRLPHYSRGSKFALFEVGAGSN